jgi:hypothetical protein
MPASRVWWKWKGYKIPQVIEAGDTAQTWRNIHVVDSKTRATSHTRWCVVRRPCALCATGHMAARPGPGPGPPGPGVYIRYRYSPEPG